jgi:integrase
MIRPMRLFNRKGFWYVEFSRGKWRSLKTRNEETAKGIFKEMEKEYLRGRLIQLDTSRKNLSEFASFYEQHRPGISDETIKKDRLSLKLLREAIGNIEIRTLNTSKIDEFKKACLTRGAKPQTVNGYLRHIKGALSYAVDEKLIEKRPKIKMVPVDEQDLAERILSPRTIRAILAVAKNEDRDLGRYFTVLLWTGARRREILNLAWQDVDLARRSALLTRTKGKRDRRVPLLPAAISALKPIKKDIGPVFPPWHPDTASKWFHAIALKCGVNARLHDLRHSAVTYMLNSGIDIRVVQKIVGHAHLSTTMLYSHLLDGVASKEMKKYKVK